MNKNNIGIAKGYILIVDDELAILDISAELLKRENYRVETANSGKEALKKISSDAPDLILLDISLFDMNGLDMCKNLKNDPQYSNICVVLMSGYESKDNVQAAFQAGAADFIPKSILHIALVPRIANQIRLLESETVIRSGLTKYENIFKTAGDAMFILKQEDGKLLDANPAAETMYGYTHKEFLNLSAIDLSAEPEKSDEARKTGQKKAALRYHRKKDGTVFPVDISANYYTENSQKLSVVNIRDITDQVTTQDGLLKSQEHYKAIFENFPALIWFSGLDALCYYFNKTWLTFTGRSLEEERGNGWAEGVHPDDFDRCLKIYLDNFNVQKPFDMDYRLKHHSGEYRWISDHGQPFYDENGEFAGYIGSCYDISEKKNRELELLKLQSAIEQIDTTIVITDANGRIEYANPFALELTGYTAQETIGKNPRIFKSGKHDKAFYAKLWQTISRGDIWKGFLTNRKKDGSFYEEEATIAPVKNKEGKIVNYVAIKQDISDKLQLEEKLRRSQKMEAIGILAAGIAHEINSPMQYILDNTRFLEDSVKDFIALVNALSNHNFKCDPANCAEIKRLVQNLDINFLKLEIPQAITENIVGIGKIRTIISALKDFSFPRSFILTDTDVNKNLETVLLISASSWKGYAEMEKQLAPNLPLVPCYADELNQVFINLLVNAVDAIREKHDKKGVIKISTALVGEFVQITIADNGVGIEDKIKNKIFQPFFTTKDVGKGTGQGLAIVYDIIYNLHKGSIDVNSEVGKGTEFIIKLPLDRRD